MIKLYTPYHTSNYAYIGIPAWFDSDAWLLHYMTREQDLEQFRNVPLEKIIKKYGYECQIDEYNSEDEAKEAGSRLYDSLLKNYGLVNGFDLCSLTFIPNRRIFNKYFSDLFSRTYRKNMKNFIIRSMYEIPHSTEIVSFRAKFKSKRTAFVLFRLDSSFSDAELLLIEFNLKE